jgi:hypothetical protein
MKEHEHLDKFETCLEDNLVKMSDVKVLDKLAIHNLGKAAAEVLTADGYNDAAPMIIAARKGIEYLTALSRALEYQATTEIAREDNKEVTAYGAVISMGSTGDRLSYKEDAVWAKLSASMKAREALLKIARKDPGSVKDVDGNDVPTVSIASPGKAVVRVKL